MARLGARVSALLALLLLAGAAQATRGWQWPLGKLSRRYDVVPTVTKHEDCNTILEARARDALALCHASARA